MQGKLISAIEFKYDRDLTEDILDTIESRLLDELDTPENHENLECLRNYIWRHWADIKLFGKRSLSATKAIGCCESDHRKYTYRVKGQGNYWSEGGAESILRVLTCINNGDLEEWLSSEFSGSQVKAIDQEKLRYAVRNSLKKAHEAHIGVQHGAIEAEVAGHSYLDKFSRALGHTNI